MFSKLQKDINGNVNYSIEPALIKYGCLLSAGLPASFTLPTEYKRYDVLFNYKPGTRVFVAINEEAGFGGDSAFVSVNAMLNPSVRRIPGGSSVYVRTPDDLTDVWVEIYAVKE